MENALSQCACLSQCVNDLYHNVLMIQRGCLDKKRNVRSLSHGMGKREAAHEALSPRTGGCLACPVS